MISTEFEIPLGQQEFKEKNCMIATRKLFYDRLELETTTKKLVRGISAHDLICEIGAFLSSLGCRARFISASNNEKIPISPVSA